jgi:peptidoglycan biosynthesis protein MviN/MurJ (putative lipid II flippase)
LIAVLFLRGEFTLDMATLVSLGLLGLVPAIVFQGLTPILSNAFYAMNMIRVPAIVMPFGTAIYLGLAMLLSARYGILGLAFAESLSWIALFIALLFLLARSLGQFSAGRAIKALLQYTITSLLSFGLTTRLLVESDLPALLSLLISLTIGGGLYLLLLTVLRDDGLTVVYQRLREISFRRSEDPAQ